MGIEAIRSSTQGLIAKMIVGAIIIVFALFGFGSITTFLAPVPKVASVGGNDVTQQEMELAVERSRQVMLARGLPVEEDRLRSGVLDSLINRQVLINQANDLDLAFSDASTDKQILTTEAFQVEGQFDAERFRQIIRNMGYQPLSYRQELQTDMKVQQLTAALSQTAFLTEKEARGISSLAQQVRDLAYVLITRDKLRDSITTTPAQLEDYYNANLSDFQTDETVDLSYIELRKDSLLSEVEVNEVEIRAQYEDRSTSYTRAERRRSSHILVAISDEVTGAQAKAKADDLHRKVLAGESFETLAKEHSDDPGSAVNGGDLGFQDAGVFVPEFEATLANLSDGDVSTPVLSDFGYHIIKLTGVEVATVTPFEEVRDRIDADVREIKAEDLFVERSARLAEIAFEAPDLRDPSVSLDLTIKTTGHVGRNNAHPVAGAPAVMEAAYLPDLLTDGNNSNLIEITPDHHVVVRVTGHSPSVQRSLAEVEALIADRIRDEKAADDALAQAVEIERMLKSGSITRFVADQFGVEWKVIAGATRSQGGVDRQVIERAFQLARPAEGRKSVGHIGLANGDAAVVTVTGIQSTDPVSVPWTELQTLARALASRSGANDRTEYQADIVTQADVSRTAAED